MAPKRKVDELGPAPAGVLLTGKEDPKNDNNGTGQPGVSACLTVKGHRHEVMAQQAR